MDLNNATYEHDSEHSDDLAENENDVHRGVEVNIKPVTMCNLLCRPFQPTCFVAIFFFGRIFKLQGSLGRSKLSIEVPVCRLGSWKY